ncbi:Chemotaxis protein methyltransferase CheR [Methylophaga frappieri]|uniref:protein-glutamate O-methyltransferase n=1 Tax=Methylophaga frappieri (strain ATCC BAA-2434 / DSM 25690 / JAM7) TaxID=754477 RepID=I1YKG9_METFJ|nr:protein-glutamate O-methyltransferase CheR [Methylophaga frappieri]AFJ03412.1 Chemotaxis protein methyltransferase CheR [Methylophaga frappieri]
MLQVSEISQQDYDAFRGFLEQACGILLGDGKQYLIINRLARLLREEKIASVAMLLTALECNSPRHLRGAVIDAMTTNETSWFRDGGPFTVFEKYLLTEIDKRLTGQGRIWSAACSSGQEPYTISILINEYLRKNPDSALNNVQIIGTDISQNMLTLAREACYEEAMLARGISATRRQQFFKPSGEQWQLIDTVRRRVQFREQNLLESFTGLGRFDVVFCRNVLIYFSAQRKADILDRMAQAMNPGGLLFLGASETISGYSDAFELRRFPEGVIYQRR